MKSNGLLLRQGRNTSSQKIETKNLTAKSNSFNNSRKISEDNSNESKNNEILLKEFYNNMFNEINMIENKIES